MRALRDDTPFVKLTEPYRDWTGHHFFEIALVNPQDRPITLAVRVHDSLHDQEHDDRFNATFDLAPKSRRTIEIPLAEIAAGPCQRSMDLSNVTDVTLFLPHRTQVGTELYLVRMRLH
jgi:hypothetical protein